MRLWKRRAATETDHAAGSPASAPSEAFTSQAVPPSQVPSPGQSPSWSSPSAEFPSSAAGSRSVRGRIQRGGALAQTLPAVTTVTAYRRDGYVVANTVSQDGAYLLEGLPAEPLTLVAVEHPAVYEEVVVRAGDQRHDISLPAFPRKDLP
ncbi:hypothetical protein HQ32_00309 [Prauserella sp. Am3]|nr:hypothetical protein HQ32_00309 [Prauserella sp. Am3]